ncbi:MAG: GTPase Der [Bacteroidia bacterium]|nr:GTPase Der [Bacteroidia bacterium]
MGNLVAIVGRPNVGKSTLFNRLTDSRSAIVDEMAGVTRDRTYGKGEWNGKKFSVIDTGGYVIGSDDIFESEIRKQVKVALDEANIILFVVDVKCGIMDDDQTVASLLRKTNKKVFLVVNKVDNHALQNDATEFYSLGLGELYNISSINGSGTGELLDEMTKHMTAEEEKEENELPKFAIVGRPNVGKSSLTNALLGIDRNIVTDIAGTTRDAIHSHYKAYGKDFILVDTAGIRKKSKVEEGLEYYSVMRSVRAIEECDVCLLMLDAKLGFEAQDMNIFSLAQKNRRGIVILVNKWDLVEKDTSTMKKMEDEIRAKLAPFKDVPILFISALNKQRIMKAVETAIEVYENRTKKIPTRELNDFILPVIESYPPPSTKGKSVKIKFVTQLPTHAPTFAFYCNLPQYIPESYSRYIENKMREHFNFTGVPIQIFFRKKT